MSLRCSSPSPSSQTPAKSSFTSIGTEAPQSRTESGRFVLGSKRRRSTKALVSSTRLASQAANALLELSEDETSTRADKIHQLTALHTKWSYEDIEEPLEGRELPGRQRQRCKAIGAIFLDSPYRKGAVFGRASSIRILHEDQIDAIRCLFYQQTDLLLLAKIGLGKSLIFQLLPFMTPIAGVVLILMPLKLLQAEQSRMINKIPNGKALVLNGENSHKHVYKQAAKGGYTHIFTSPEIALSKKFKNYILDDPDFTDRLCLLAIDVLI